MSHEPSTESGPPSESSVPSPKRLLEASRGGANDESLFGTLPYFRETSKMAQAPEEANTLPFHTGVPSLRRSRAETFSTFPSKLLTDDLNFFPSVGGAGNSPQQQPPVNPVTTGGRVRSGSLTLPAADVSSAFGSTLFGPNWQPAPAENGLGYRSTLQGVALSSTGSNEGRSIPPNVDLSTRLMRTSFENFSLNSGNEEFDSGASDVKLAMSSVGNSRRTTSISSGSVYNGINTKVPSVGVIPAGPPSPGSMQAYMRGQTSPKLENSGFNLSPSAGLIQNRFRSFSVNVGDNIAPPLQESSVYRPRSTSFGFLEGGNYRSEMDGSRRGTMLDHSDHDEDGYYNSDPMQDGQTSSRSVWVGNLDISLSPADLLSVFSPFGPIESLRILPEKECAFVNFVHVEDAVRAKEDMHGVMVGSTVIKLGFGKVESINDHYAVQPTKSLWIGNIPANTDPADLESIFSVFGSVESARVLSHKNCGFVNFDRLEDAIEAKRTMNGHEIGGVVMKIGYAKVPGKGEANYPAQFPQKTGFTAAPQYPSAGPPNTQTVGGVTLRERSQSSPTTGSSSNSSTYSQGNGVGSGKSVATAPQQEAAAPTTPVDAESYAPTLLPLPEPNPNRRVDQNRLREMRKRLEGHPSAKDVETYFQEVFADTVDLCTDYIGNVVLQKIIEKGTDTHLLHLLEAVAPHMATIGVHKNGTWVVQKMIDSAKTPAQMAVVVSAIRPFTPPLLLDQFGNYVVQCCLRLGTQRNQFIFDAMHTKCWDIAQGRFGARAMRACLESQHTTKRQQKHVAISIVQNSVLLVTNPNGALLITWLLDSSSLPGRYRVLAPKLAPIVPSLCTHKLASATILKLINQRVELDARDVIIKELFFRDDLPLREVLSDSVHGVTVIQKILATGCLSTDERVFLADRVRSVLPRVDVKETQAGYKRLLDELSVIPSNVVFGPYINGGGLDGRDPNSNDEAVSPLTPQARSPLDKDGYPVGGFTTPVFYPSPHNSPQPGSVAARVGGVGVALQNTTYHNGFNNSGPTAQAGGSGYLPSPQTSLAATYQTPGRDGRHPQAKGPSFAQY